MASTLEQFYADLVIFITGGTGFLEKLLLLKLLQSCPDIGSMIVSEREAWTESVKHQSSSVSVTVFFFSRVVTATTQLTPGAFTETPNRSDGTNTTNKCNNTTNLRPKSQETLSRPR
jgi:hypothetical protein